MPNIDKPEEDKNKYGPLVRPAGRFNQSEKKLWRLQGALLAVFLLSAGIFLWHAFRNAACRLTGTTSADISRRMSYESSEPDAGGRARVFDSRNDEDEEQAGGENAFHAEAAGPAGGQGKSYALPKDSGGEGERNGVNTDSRQSAGLSNTRLNTADPQSFGGISAGVGRRSSFFARVSGEGGAAAGITESSSKKKASAHGKNADDSVLGTLKDLWKLTIYGARAGSRDSAHNWVAQGFDKTGDTGKGIEYPENVKRSLDRIDPNSIPRYLKGDVADTGRAHTLAVAQVGKPEVDEDAAKKDPKYQAMKAIEKMTQGLMNPLFGGFGGGAFPPSDYKGDYSDPESDPTLENLNLIGNL